jgi:peptide/nickel transport system permease protein
MRWSIRAWRIEGAVDMSLAALPPTDRLPPPERLASRLRGAYRGNPMLAFGSVMVALSIVLMAIGPWIAPFDPQAVVARPSLPPPALPLWPGLLWGKLTGTLSAPVHWFGTDGSGFDIASRVLAAPRTDVAIALSANLFSFAIGVGLGLVAGYFRNRGIELMMRISDLVQSFPVFISGMILVALAGRSASNIVIALALLYAPIYLRLTRAEVMAQRHRAYVEAARALGNSELTVAIRHVLPNALAPALIQSSVTIGFSILMTAGLSFVGAGVRPPTPEWGLMIATGANDIVQGEWWPSVFPGLAISLTVFGYAAFANGLERFYGR